jgi:tRNA threonylcarbamoyladenosine biosynthesis protein TsaE
MPTHVGVPPLPGTGEAVSLTRSQLVTWGEELGGALAAPRLVTIAGELGAGKTTLVQAIARGYGVTEAVTSPTFALVHVYRAARSDVYHLDLYRLRDERDLLQIGWEEMIEAPALILVEWPERAGAALPPVRTEIVLQHPAQQGEGDEERRLLTVR